jgi:hypothetical protein
VDDRIVPFRAVGNGEADKKDKGDPEGNLLPPVGPGGAVAVTVVDILLDFFE